MVSPIWLGGGGGGLWYSPGGGNFFLIDYGGQELMSPCCSMKVGKELSSIMCGSI